MGCSISASGCKNFFLKNHANLNNPCYFSRKKLVLNREPCWLKPCHPGTPVHKRYYQFPLTWWRIYYWWLLPCVGGNFSYVYCRHVPTYLVFLKRNELRIMQLKKLTVSKATTNFIWGRSFPFKIAFHR